MEHHKDPVRKKNKKREHLIHKPAAKKQGGRRNTNPNTKPPEIQTQVAAVYESTKRKVTITEIPNNERIPKKTTQVVSRFGLRRVKTTHFSTDGVYGDNDSDEEEDEDEFDVGPQPPPYWEQLLVGNKSLVKDLKQVEDIGEAMDDNPDLITYVFKHPTFGKQISQDPKLAHEVVEHPTDFKRIAHRVSAKGSQKKKHHIMFLGHKYHIDDVQIHLEDRARMITRSELSLEGDRQILDNGHILKALLGVERVYLKHDEIIYEGFLVFCDRKMHRYFFQDIHGKTIYHIRDYQFFTRDCLRRCKYDVLDAEGNEVLRMVKRFTLTGNQLVDVYSPPKHFIGSIRQSCGCKCKTPSFWIRNADHHDFMEVRCGNRGFKSYWDRSDTAFEFIIKVVSTQHDMGLISTVWYEKQMQTYSFEPFYGIHWNNELTLNVKGLLLSTMLLVYLTHYKGRLDRRLYIERYKTPPRPSFSVFEGENDNYEDTLDESPQIRIENELTKPETDIVETKHETKDDAKRTSIGKS